MKLRSIREVNNLNGKRVLLRTGLDLAKTADNKLDQKDNFRIIRALPTIRYLLEKKAVVIILNHFGRPQGEQVPHLQHDAIAKKLSEHLNMHITKLDEITGSNVTARVQKAKAGEVIMLENVRFDKREKVKKNISLAKELSEFSDLYTNDAFSNSHRDHTSMLGITKFLPSYAGLLLEEEVKNLSDIFENPQRPICTVIGGAKIETKIGVIKTFLHHAQNVLIGGALANTVLKAKGISVGKSLVDEKMIAEVGEIDLTNAKLHLPVDIACGNAVKKTAKATFKAIGNVSDHEYILDIGPDTIYLFKKVLSKARTIIWNGPMGFIELDEFTEGTKAIINSMIHSKAQVIMGGGDSINVFNALSKKSVEAYHHIYVSTGGGAMLKFLENKTLPALEPLLIKN